MKFDLNLENDFNRIVQTTAFPYCGYYSNWSVARHCLSHVMIVHVSGILFLTFI